MEPLFDKIDNWFKDLKEYAEQSPNEFLKNMEYILDSSFFEEVYEKLDSVRSSLEDTREQAEEKLKPGFCVEKFKKLINFVDIVYLEGTYIRADGTEENLFLNASGKIRPPVNTFKPDDTFKIKSVEGLLVGTQIYSEEILHMLDKL